MDNFLHRRVGDQFPEWPQVQIRQGIDQGDPRGRSRLDQTQFWQVREFANELAVVGEGPAALERLEQFGKLLLPGNKLWPIPARKGMILVPGLFVRQGLGMGLFVTEGAMLVSRRPPCAAPTVGVPAGTHGELEYTKRDGQSTFGGRLPWHAYGNRIAVSGGCKRLKKSPYLAENKPVPRDWHRIGAGDRIIARFRGAEYGRATRAIWKEQR